MVRRSWLLVGFCFVGVLAVMSTGHFSYARARASLESATFDRLTALRQAKRREIEGYFVDLRDHVALLASRESIGQALDEMSLAFGSLRARDGDIDATAAFYTDQFAPRYDGADPELFIPIDERALAGQARYLALNESAVGSKDDLIDAGDGSEYTRAHARHHEPMRAILETYGFYDVFLISGEGGRIVYSVFKEIDFATSLERGPHHESNLARVYREAIGLPPGGVAMGDFERYAPSYGAPAAFLASPVRRDGATIGVLAVQVPVDRINGIMTGDERWREDGLGESGETYLVGRDLLMRSDSRFILEYPERFLARLEERGPEASEVREEMKRHSTTILFERVDTHASREALEGVEGSGEVLDYRGLPVLSSYAPVSIDGQRWAILSEIDVAEAFAPVHALRMRLLAASSFIALLFVGAGVAISLVIQRNERMSRDRDRIANDLSVASSIQQGLLPKEQPVVDGFDLAGWNRPAEQTGGDYFDWQEVGDGRVAITLADVTGHGIGPALVTAVCRAYARASFHDAAELPALMQRINDLLVDDLPSDRFVTFVAGVLDAPEGWIDLLSAGHGPQVIYRAQTGEVEMHEAHGLPFGIMAGTDYPQPDRITLKPGDALVFLTDGFFEWLNPTQEEMYGLDRLALAVRAGAQGSAQSLIDHVLSDVEEFVGESPQADDLTMVVIKRT